MYQEYLPDLWFWEFIKMYTKLIITIAHTFLQTYFELRYILYI